MNKISDNTPSCSNLLYIFCTQQSVNFISLPVKDFPLTFHINLLCAFTFSDGS